MSKRRLLFVLENYHPHIGGVENGFKTLCEGLAARDFQVTVVTRAQPDAPRTERLAGVDIVRVPSFGSRYAFTFCALFEAIKRARTVDAIHTTTFNAAPVAWLAGFFSGRPVVLTVNETWIGKWREYTDFSGMKAFVHELLERAVFAFHYDAYACISNATAARLAEVLPKRRARMRTIYYGFDPKPWSASEGETLRSRWPELEGRYVVLGYGRPGISKGFEYLVRAFPLVRAAIPNATLVLILSNGQQYAATLRALKRIAGPHVTFLPSQAFSKLPAYVADADCVVIPSIVEGFGYTTLEATAAGSIVVASDTTSIPEVIGGRFRLVKPRDPESIAAGVIAVASGAFTTEPIREFPWETSIDEYESLYRSLYRSEQRSKRAVLEV